MDYGFVYVLGNDAMPGIYKIGFTERAPSARIGELSKSTAAALPFDLICYGEFEDARVVEYEMHKRFEDRRVNESREFFYGPLRDIVEDLERAWGAESFCHHNSEHLIWMEESALERKWLVNHFFEQCADPIHWSRF